MFSMQWLPEAYVVSHYSNQANTTTSVDSMFAHRLRQWANIESTLVQRREFAGKSG